MSRLKGNDGVSTIRSIPMPPETRAAVHETTSCTLPRLSMKPNPNTEVPIHITPHHLSLTPGLSRFVHDKIAKLPRFAGDAVAADIVLRRHHGSAEGKTFSASARLSLPGHDVHATATHADLYTAITSLTKKLTRRSLKRKTRRGRESKNLRRSARRNRPAVLRDALERWAEASAKASILDAFLLAT